MVGLAVLRMVAPIIRAAPPNSSTSASAFVGRGLGAGQLADGGEQGAHRRRQPHRPVVRADPRDGRGQLGHGVLAVDHRPVPGAAAGGQPQPRHPLLGGLDEVEPPAADRGAEAADLADGLGAVGELVGVAARPGCWAPSWPPASSSAVKHSVIGRSGTRAGRGRGPDDGEQHRVEVLHVDRAAAPQAAVADLARERVDLPVLGGGRDDVQVAVQQQRRRRAGPVPPQLGDTLVRPGSASNSVASMPTSSSSAATCSAAFRSPGPSPSP